MRNFYRKSIWMAILIVPFLLQGYLARANTITVNSLIDENPMTTNGLCSLREALQNANNDSQDEPDCDVPNGDDIIDMRGLSGELDLLAAFPGISSNLTILGPGATALTIKAGGAYRIFDTASSALILSISGLTLSNGAPSAGGGGAIFLEATDTLNLSDCSITGNNLAANFGAGIRNKGFLNIDDCIISDNHITAGTGEGAGVSIEGGVVTIRNSTIAGNTSTNGLLGGGIALVEGSLILVNSTVSGNSAAGGGGIFLSAPVSPVTATLLSSTITDNHATNGEGGGLGISTGTPADATVTIKNSILAGNTASLEGADCTDDNGLSGTVTSQGHNILGIDDQCAGEFDGSGDRVGTLATPLSPDLSALADNGGPTPTHALQAGSPAIDGGDPAGCRDENGVLLSSDQRGFSRAADGDANGSAICDVGAVENSCGDGVLNAGEACDDGSANSDTQPNTCRSTCQLASCGDGVVDAGEACDDGNTVSGDGCDSDCSLPSCGNGILDTGEACDDGNSNNQDDCSNNCLNGTMGSGSSSGGCGITAGGLSSGASLLVFAFAILGAVSYSRLQNKNK